MCLSIYMGTDTELQLNEYVAGKTFLYLENLTSPDEEKSLRLKFSKKNIYYVGSHTGCSCGFILDDVVEEEEDDEERILAEKSAHELIHLIKELTQTENVEYYACWDGDWDLPILNKKSLDIVDVAIGRNYFVDGTEQEFILFKK